MSKQSKAAAKTTKKAEIIVQDGIRFRKEAGGTYTPFGTVNLDKYIKTAAAKAKFARFVEIDTRITEIDAQPLTTATRTERKKLGHENMLLICGE
jgi:hypothetical protein